MSLFNRRKSLENWTESELLGLAYQARTDEELDRKWRDIFIRTGGAMAVTVNILQVEVAENRFEYGYAISALPFAVGALLHFFEHQNVKTGLDVDLELMKRDPQRNWGYSTE